MARPPRLTGGATLADVGGESILLAGALRALLLQISSPLVALGVREHSDFANDPLRRLHGTLRYLYTLSFGTPARIEAVLGEVRAAHRPVHSAPGSSPAYSARDPDLQLWVAATLYDTTVQLHELTFGPLDNSAAEAIYRDSARIGTALGMPADRWPADRAAFARYWSGQLTAVRPNAESRRLAQELIEGRSLPLPLRILLPTVARVTAVLLPDEARSALGISSNPLVLDRGRRTLARIIRLYRLLPRTLRTLPARRYSR